jgi:hypothetical protein
MSRYRHEYNPQQLGHLCDRDLLWKVLELQVITLEQVLKVENKMATQADVDAIKASIDQFGTDLSTALDGIQSDLDALKLANPALDLTALQASTSALSTVVSRATDVDAENPVVPPAV